MFPKKITRLTVGLDVGINNDTSNNKSEWNKYVTYICENAYNMGDKIEGKDGDIMYSEHTIIILLLLFLRSKCCYNK